MKTILSYLVNPPASIVRAALIYAFIWHMDDKGAVRFYEPQSGKRAAYKLLAVRLVEA